MAAEWGEMLVRRRSSHAAFSRLPSAFDGLTKEELDELKREYFLDDKEVQTYIIAFRKYDKDKSGDIDSEEIALLLKDLGLNFPPADVYDMIQAVDVDGSGTIGVPEFITLIADPDGPLGLALLGALCKQTLARASADLCAYCACARRMKQHMCRRLRGLPCRPPPSQAQEEASGSQNKKGRTSAIVSSQLRR